MKYKLIKEWFIPIILAVIISKIFIKHLGFIVHVPTNSMYPTINKDEYFIVSVLDNKNIKRGDILVFRHENKNLVKRVIGLPGEVVKIIGNKVFINGKEIYEPYVKNNGGNEGEYKVPDNEYFFLGDNRCDSKDGRYWDYAYVTSSEIKGKIKYRIFPLNKLVN